MTDACHPRHRHAEFLDFLTLVAKAFRHRQLHVERPALRRGDFASVDQLVVAIRRFCEGWNQRCQSFTWTKDADQILAKLRRRPPRRPRSNRLPAARPRRCAGRVRVGE